MNTLLIFAKEPKTAKQRLRTALPAGQVTRLAEAFLRDTLYSASQLEDTSVRLLYAPRSAEPRLRAVVDELQWNSAPTLWCQRGRALGARLEAAFGDAFREGAGRVIAIGTDSPSLPIDSVDSGFHLLEHHDCVLGPTLDGGYYLIGLSRPTPALFRDIDWSQSTVYRDTITRVEVAGLTYRELPVWYDVDTPDDLEFLVRDINQFRLAGDERRVHHTEQILSQILKAES